MLQALHDPHFSLKLLEAATTSHTAVGHAHGCKKRTTWVTDTLCASSSVRLQKRLGDAQLTTQVEKDFIDTQLMIACRNSV